MDLDNKIVRRDVSKLCWMVQTMIEESKDKLEFMGAILPRHANSDCDEDTAERRLISIQLGWEGEIKDVSSMFVGTSPEFELALYSLCFFAGEEENRISCGGYDLTIKCYRINSKYGDKVRARRQFRFQN